MLKRNLIAAVLVAVGSVVVHPVDSNAQGPAPRSETQPPRGAARFPVPEAPAPGPDAIDAAQSPPARKKMPSGVVVSVSEDTLTEFAQAAMPLTLKGTNVIQLNIPVVGFLEITVPWVAVVNDPRIIIEKGLARFDAAVSVMAAGILYNDRIQGTFDVVHDPEKNCLVVSVKEAFLNLRVKRRRATTERRVDVANQLSSLDLPIPLPGSQMKIGGRPARLELAPTVECQEGAIVISTPVHFVPRKPTVY